MGILEKPEIPRKMCPVIFLLDTSYSMEGAPIGAVDDAMEGVLPELVSMNGSNPDVQIMVAVMSFNSNVEWIFGEDTLLLPEEIPWESLSVSGATSMGEAFRSLNEKLSVTHGFMQRASGSVAPVLFLMSDGEPTDDYQSGLQKLKNNNWYKIAVRVAVGYGDSNDDVLREFTGNRETVLHASTPAELKKMIKFIAVTSSRVASQGKVVSPDDANANPDDNTQPVAEAIKNQGALGNASAEEDW